MYAELHCHSNHSLLDGASHPEELAARAAALDMPALALTDHDAVYAAPRFLRAAREQGIQPILGAELTLFDDDRPDDHHHLTLLVESQLGWHNLCYLISRARSNAPKGQAALPVSELIGCTTGLIALSGCRKGKLASSLLRGGVHKAAVAAARRYVQLFGRDNFWIELQRHFLPDDDRLVGRLVALAEYLKLGCVVTNNVHYHVPERHRLQDVLVCIRHLTTLDASVHLRRTNTEYCLKPARQMAALFPDHPQALSNTLAIAERCRFQLSYGLQDLPSFPTPHGMSTEAYLRRLCQEALPERYPDAPSRIREQLAHELAVIERAELSNYFLIVWDIVRFAREQGIRCQGRGSAANSLVAYLLHISPVDPIAQNLVFERFLSDERRAEHGSHADIDIDFDAQRREEVIQYLYRTYGPDHAAMACTFVTFRARSAVRDIGKALGLAPHLVATVAHAIEHGDPAAMQDVAERNTLKLLLELSEQIEGFPRHLGIHSGGMVITGAPLMGRVPAEPATMAGRVVVQWDKEGLEDVGLVKIDILGLRMLSAISDAAALIAKTEGAPPDLDGLCFTDPAVYRMIGEAGTIGVFQVESRAQAQVLPRLKPQCFDDLIVAISLIRPGPIQGNMVHPYLRRRQGMEPVTYLHPSLEPALRETLGVILFQEQVLKVARNLAGFTPGQGEQLRRALGTKQAAGEIEKFRAAFLSGATTRGVTAEVAETVFQQLLAFGGYSFAKSHATAFAVLVYQSGWLKRYHPQAFYTALLNNQPMGFWNAAVLVNELRRQTIPVLPVDIHHSQAKCSIETEGIRLGLNYVKQIAGGQIQRILALRAGRPFASLNDFCRRARIPHNVVENLILCGAMDTWGIPRRQLLWELGTLRYGDGELDLSVAPDTVVLPPLSSAEAMLAEQAILGLSHSDHIMTLYRAQLRARGILGSRELAACPDGRPVRVAGLLVVHQSPPTAKGFHFLTLEDEDGMVNVIVRPAVYDQYRHFIHSERLLIVEGRVQREGEVGNVVGEGVSALGL